MVQLHLILLREPRHRTLVHHLLELVQNKIWRRYVHEPYCLYVPSELFSADTHNMFNESQPKKHALLYSSKVSRGSLW